MQVVESLHDMLSIECPHIHSARLTALMRNVDALMSGQKLTVTGLGRAPGRRPNTKHQIKQSDRLIGNPHLDRERESIYRAITRRLLKRTPSPIILVDWSDYTHNRSHILLRASVPVAGRALTLYEEVHPLASYGNATIQTTFLDTLHRFIGPTIKPIVVTDAGFIGPWFTAVRKLGWHFVGRIRKNLLYCEKNTTSWTRCAELYDQCTTQPKYFGPIELARKQPVSCHLHLLWKKPKGRHCKTASGKRARRKASEDHVKRETTPWLIVTSLAPKTYRAKHVMQIYRTRMQIELAFRDIKNTRAGLALRETRSRTQARLANLLLVGMLASFCLWLIGRLAVERKAHYQLQANTVRDQKVLSVFFIACQLVAHHRLPTQLNSFQNALTLVRRDIKAQSQA